MIALGLLAVAASVYLVYVLEILKFRRLDACACGGCARMPQRRRSSVT